MQCFKHRRNAPYLHPPDSSNLPILPIQGWLPWLQVGPIAFRDFYLIEFWPSTLSPHTSSSRRRCASFMLRLLLAALWDAQTFCLGLGQLLEITIAHNKSCGCAFGVRFFCRAVVMHDWNTHTHIYIYIYVALLRCVTCMSTVSLPHYHWVPFPTLFGVPCRCIFLHKGHRWNVLACSWVMSDAGGPNACWLLLFLLFLSNLCFARCTQRFWRH